MRLTLLGTGTPSPNPKRHGPSYLISHDGKQMLIDCGPGMLQRLVEAGSAPEKIDSVFITHLHADHYADLGYLILARWFRGNSSPLPIYAPAGIQKIVELWMQLNEYDIQMRAETRIDEPRPEPRPIEIKAGDIYEANGLRVSAFGVTHYPIHEPYGFKFSAGNRSIVFTGDCGPCDSVVQNAQTADFLVHECTDFDSLRYRRKGGKIGKKEEMRELLRNGHTSPEDLGRIAQKARVKCVIASHLHPNSEPTAIKEKIKLNYAGQVIVGEDLMSFEV